MTRSARYKLPRRLGVCTHCHKDNYPDTISAQLALEFFNRNPHRGMVEPIRYYPCPVSTSARPKYHLTSQPKNDIGNREIQHSA